MSTQPNINGSNQFLNPPIKIGITIKKIIKKAWAVIKTLKICPLPINLPNFLNSIRIIILIEEPINPIKIPKKK